MVVGGNKLWPPGSAVQSVVGGGSGFLNDGDDLPALSPGAQT